MSAGGMQPFILDSSSAPIVIVGRIPEAHIVLPERFDKVSRLHAALHSSQAADGSTGWELVDHRTANGTFVNGQQIERARLRDGDVVVFGPPRARGSAPYRWRYHASSPAAAGRAVLALEPAAARGARRERRDGRSAEPPSAAKPAQQPPAELEPFAQPGLVDDGAAEGEPFEAGVDEAPVASGGWLSTRRSAAAERTHAKARAGAEGRRPGAPTAAPREAAAAAQPALPAEQSQAPPTEQPPAKRQKRGGYDRRLGAAEVHKRERTRELQAQGATAQQLRAYPFGDEWRQLGAEGRQAYQLQADVLNAARESHGAAFHRPVPPPRAGGRAAHAGAESAAPPAAAAPPRAFAQPPAFAQLVSAERTAADVAARPVGGTAEPAHGGGQCPVVLARVVPRCEGAMLPLSALQPLVVGRFMEPCNAQPATQIEDLDDTQQ